MNHNEYKELLSALLDGELSDAERETALAHLDACEDCRAYFAELSAMHAALGEMEEYDAPEGFAGSVMERLHKEGAKKVPDHRKAVKPRRPWRTWGALAACAAVVVLAVSTLPNALRMGSKSASTEAAPAATAPMMAAPVAPPDEYRTAATAGGGGTPEEAAPAASEYGVNALYAANGDAPAVPVAPGEPIVPTDPTAQASDESKVRVASDSGVPMTIVTTGPNGETVPAPGAPMNDGTPAASMNDGATSGTENSVAESTAPVMTLMGNGAADWLAEHGEPLGDGRWRVSVEDVNTLPDTLALVAADGLQEPVDGMLIVTYGTTENPR